MKTIVDITKGEPAHTTAYQELVLFGLTAEIVLDSSVSALIDTIEYGLTLSPFSTDVVPTFIVTFAAINPYTKERYKTQGPSLNHEVQERLRIPVGMCDEPSSGPFPMSALLDEMSSQIIATLRAIAEQHHDSATSHLTATDDLKQVTTPATT